MASLRTPLLGICVLAFTVSARAAELPAGLSITTRTVGEIAGRFEHGGSTVRFLGRMEAPGQAYVKLEVEALKLEVWADFQRQQARTEGHGSVMTAEARRAIEALYFAVRPLMKSADAVLVSHEALLFRRLAFWAEAPLGAVFGVRTIGPPSHAFDMGPRGGFDAAVTPAACQASDENGIHYFSCSVSSQVECHDAATHCWTCATRPAGKNSSGCAGECGPGCDGLNIYTWDCLDHDYCGRIHGGSLNPWDAECGDEFWEADDDFLWGWPNC